MLGPGRVGSPRAVDGHRPERFALADYAPASPPAFARPSRTGRGLLAIRVLRPPVELEVLVEDREAIGVGAGLAPARCRPVSLKNTAPDATPPISGSIRVASGPWSMEEGWWSDAPADRNYWDVELSDGALYRIYRDRKSGAWFADGIYD